MLEEWELLKHVLETLFVDRKSHSDFLCRSDTDAINRDISQENSYCNINMQDYDLQCIDVNKNNR